MYSRNISQHYCLSCPELADRSYEVMGYNNQLKVSSPIIRHIAQRTGNQSILTEKQFSCHFRTLNNHLHEKSPVSLGRYSLNSKNTPGPTSL
jgi:hypothetical protein